MPYRSQWALQDALAVMTKIENRLANMRDQWETLRVKAEREMDPLALSRLAKVRDEMALLSDDWDRVDDLIRRALRVDYERDAEDEWAEALDDK